MGHIDSFDEFLKKKNQADENNIINWDERKATWLNSINFLYNEIRNWLKPFVEKNLIKIKDDKLIDITEEYIGHYNTNRLDIYLGNDIVSLTPKGTLIMGSYGRIDMSGSRGDIMLIEPDWNKWNFAKRTPKIETWDVTEDSFKDILQELV